MDNMENSFYYTFSTIAQVLSAFLALSGVFVLYQLQRYINLQIVSLNYFVENFIARRQDLKFIQLERELNDIIQLGMFTDAYITLTEFANDSSIGQLGDLSIYTGKYANKIKLIEQKKFKLLFLTKISLLIGVITILYSLLILANVPCIVNNYIGCKLLFLTVGIVGITICLSTMAYAIFISLNINPK